MTKRGRVAAVVVVVALILVAVALVALLKGEETPDRGSSQMMRSGRTVRPKPADLEEADPRGPAVPSHTGITVLAADGAPVGSAVVTFRAIRGIRIGPEDLDTPLGVTDAERDDPVARDAPGLSRVHQGMASGAFASSSRGAVAGRRAGHSPRGEEPHQHQGSRGVKRRSTDLWRRGRGDVGARLP